MTRTDALRLADEARKALAAEYRHIAETYVAHAERLLNTSLEELADQPVPYVHRRTRDLEEALESALLEL